MPQNVINGPEAKDKPTFQQFTVRKLKPEPVAKCMKAAELEPVDEYLKVLELESKPMFF